MLSPSNSRARTPSNGDNPLQSINENQDGQYYPRRRGSFGFLRRSKSGDRVSSVRSVSSGKLSKKQRILAREQEMQREQIPGQAPVIPDLPAAPQLQTFGGEDARPDSVAIMSNRVGKFGPNKSVLRDSMDTASPPRHYGIPVPPVPGDNSKQVDPYARTESMTNRGRYSYASSMVSGINSPRRLRRRKDPTPFNVLVIGARNSGKTSFLNFLRTSLALPAGKQRPPMQDDSFDIRTSSSENAFPNFTSHYLETEMESERIGLTLWDSQGLETSIVDLQLREMSSFLESKFEDTFAEENKVVRAPGVRDTHIHCVFLILDPARLDTNIAGAKRLNTKNGAVKNGNSFLETRSSLALDGLDENLDLQVLRTLQGKTTVIPVISKADTITSVHMAHLKRTVWASLKKAGLDTLETLGLEDGEAESTFDPDQLNEHDEDIAATDAERQGDSRKLSDANLSNTSQLESPSSTSTSHFSAADFDLAKASGKAADAQAPVVSIPEAPPTTESAPFLPLSIISPDIYEPDVVGRKFPWGFADPYDTEHCDFLRLKEAVFNEWRRELREASRDIWYEGWRTSRLNGRNARAGRGVGEHTMKRWRP